RIQPAADRDSPVTPSAVPDVRLKAQDAASVLPRDNPAGWDRHLWSADRATARASRRIALGSVPRNAGRRSEALVAWRQTEGAVRVHAPTRKVPRQDAAIERVCRYRAEGALP